jgi:type II secretory pathway pseudopilin PulG
MIELLLVIAIIGITATFVLPRVRFDNTRVDTAARTIDLVLMAAQRDAVSRQHNVLVVFDTSAGMLRTVWDANQNQGECAGGRQHIGAGGGTGYARPHAARAALRIDGPRRHVLPHHRPQHAAR